MTVYNRGYGSSRRYGRGGYGMGGYGGYGGVSSLGCFIAILFWRGVDQIPNFSFRFSLYLMLLCYRLELFPLIYSMVTTTEWEDMVVMEWEDTVATATEDTAVE